MRILDRPTVEMEAPNWCMPLLSVPIESRQADGDAAIERVMMRANSNRIISKKQMQLTIETGSMGPNLNF